MVTTSCSHREQLVQWFDGSHLNRSPAQWDPAKLAWVNAHYIKHADDGRLAALVAPFVAARGQQADPGRLPALCGLYKDRCSTLVELADWLGIHFADVAPSEADLATHVTEAVRPALLALRERFTQIDWDKPTIAAAMKAVLDRVRPEDAATRAGGARAGVRSCADPVHRRGAGALSA